MFLNLHCSKIKRVFECSLVYSILWSDLNVVFLESIEHQIIT